MRTIEYELDEAAKGLRELSRDIPNRRWSEPPPHQRSRLLVAVAATVLVLIAIGLPALFTTAEGPLNMANAGTINDSTPVPEPPSTFPNPALTPLLAVLPEGFSLENATPVFSDQGKPDEVAIRYLEDRLHEGAESRGLRIESLKPAGRWLVARWIWETAEGENAAGHLILRENEADVDVLAATTDGVDLSELTLVEGRLNGSITTTETIGNLAADVLDADGEPVSGSPYPEGPVPAAEYRWGTAGYSEQGPLPIDIAGVTEPVKVRVNLIGGGWLTISEVGLSPTG